MRAPRLLSAGLLAVAVSASIATSTEEIGTGDPIAPIAPYDHAGVLTPGTSIQVDFRVGLPVGQLGQVQSSWATVAGLVPPQGGGEVEIVLERETASELLPLQSSVDEPYEDAVLVDGLFTGCVESSGTCWNTWTVTITHSSGPATEVHWAFDSFANGSGGAIAHQVLEF